VRLIQSIQREVPSLTSSIYPIVLLARDADIVPWNIVWLWRDALEADVQYAIGAYYIPWKVVDVIDEDGR
jgi:hypothetical protein